MSLSKTALPRTARVSTTACTQPRGTRTNSSGERGLKTGAAFTQKQRLTTKTALIACQVSPQQTYSLPPRSLLLRQNPCANHVLIVQLRATSTDWPASISWPILQGGLGCGGCFTVESVTSKRKMLAAGGRGGSAWILCRRWSAHRHGPVRWIQGIGARLPRSRRGRSAFALESVKEEVGMAG